MIKGPKNVVVDTGNPWDRDHILDGMYMCVCLKKKMLQIIESGNSELRSADHLSTNTGSFNMYKKIIFPSLRPEEKWVVSRKDPLLCVHSWPLGSRWELEYV